MSIEQPSPSEVVREDVRAKAIADLKRGLEGAGVTTFTDEEIDTQLREQEEMVRKTGLPFEFSVPTERGEQKIKIQREPNGELGYEVIIGTDN